MEKIRPVIFCTPVAPQFEGPLVVFTAQLTAVFSRKNRAYHHSVLTLADGEAWEVKETPEDVIRMMRTELEDEAYVSDMFEAFAEEAEEEECEND